jgi:hypothetical protein
MTVLHDLFWGAAYIAGSIIMLGAILAGIGFLVAAATKKK